MKTYKIWLNDTIQDLDISRKMFAQISGLSYASLFQWQPQDKDFTPRIGNLITALQTIIILRLDKVYNRIDTKEDIQHELDKLILEAFKTMPEYQIAQKILTQKIEAKNAKKQQ